MMKYVSWPTLLCSQVATRAADARPRTGGWGFLFGCGCWGWRLFGCPSKCEGHAAKRVLRGFDGNTFGSRCGAFALSSMSAGDSDQAGGNHPGYGLFLEDGPEGGPGGLLRL